MSPTSKDQRELLERIEQQNKVIKDYQNSNVKQFVQDLNKQHVIATLEKLIEERYDDYALVNITTSSHVTYRVQIRHIQIIE